MRTKTLILTAAMGILGTASSMAQVYSQNAVGFYTLNLVQGFNLIANQLINGDNNLNTIIPATSAMPDGSTVLTWDAAGQTFNEADTFFAGFGWFDSGLNASSTTLSAGEGAFVQASAAADIVLVGDVPQGDPLTLDLVEGFQMVSQLTPQSLGLDVTGFPAADGDVVLFYDSSVQNYEAAITYFAGFGWVDQGLNLVDPTPLIGEAVFYQRSAGAGGAQWARTFSVNP
jgi:hypothetical protein